MTKTTIAKGFELTEAIKEHSAIEMDKAIRIMSSDVKSFRLTISAVNNKKTFEVECNVKFIDRKSLSCSSKNEDMYIALDEAISKIVELDEKEHKKAVKEKRHVAKPSFEEDCSDEG